MTFKTFFMKIMNYFVLHCPISNIICIVFYAIVLACVLVKVFFFSVFVCIFFELNQK